ncbi:TRAP transporter substrate-binding protein DctP [Marinovum sp. 2_MG-2023]|uniref:TRAP transporter substrate-binding protein DctP n=1 Tax=Roseobacteraceae TaxID=2854170 RepID=UPI001FD233D3|nr:MULTISPECIES: TRAP transporter substrate-binding protein DctP [Roseobacteraceae]MCJ7873275.1 TRAP transporter substrate-binding protein DctP [Phaeobacter sp. J2-8]MDO6729187.1 TRAP transporter substrate-binding protein DctP [Marinovum sp. 2_MG-2023]MDO6779186.1 TRAP transporter substrate-binding protein DctP [Marinovum sp. 1_MG-2023]
MTKSLTRRALATMAAGAFALASLPGAAKSQDTELLFNVFIPQAAPLFTKGLEPWARAVEAASNGTLTLTIPTSSLAPPPRLFDIVQDGVADIAVAPISFRENQFALDLIGSVPLIAPTARGASVALWDTHKTYFAEADKWDDFVLLTLFTLGAPAIISNAHPIRSKADLDGFKVLAVGDVNVTVWDALGASPVSGSGQKPFETLSSGVADGATNPLGTAAVQGLLDASKSVTLVPGGFGGRAVFALFISRDRFEDLPEQAQTALISASGADAAAKFGQIMDDIDASGLKKFQDKGIEIIQASDSFVAEIETAGAFAVEDWLNEAKSAGIDGTAALAHFKTIATRD